ncbi:DUF4302 domain-containing protein [Bacteroides fragilis]|jgi:hypothetical protein|uniref:DUF4302 domain-containing protein n=1 Tax=Bacteroides fragilis TaxID=817 RepID=A0A413JYG3_BACFG|nr:MULTISPECIES: DUF4302 domain-containing protein [Bacteroides]EKA81542.1 hypothetical protein HMPREF1205_03500 [Bacteroides fragilis HMW 616]MBU3039601.1 DUF4302 domain-containing protein [Bacteroides sp. HF-4919]MCE8631331.1 DUF4302 domain-containing protein [Bacteroides fragilis]MCE8684203.1 DUF4302 domain-containing protein [Bacteroides fragilis]MCM0221714.1 DUF4302 domain-containing protein [Bacteroides fragilis]
MKTGFRILILIMAFFSCKDEKTFDLSPSERNAKHISELRKELVNAPYGWSVTYFPRTDSLLFTNVNELITLPKGIFEEKYKYGYGGHCFLMRFSDNGIVEAVADYTEQSLQEVRQSEFEVSQNTFTQLSFTTYNYLHSLVNDRFTGSSDFLYTGKDIDGNLIFKTSSYIEPAREYIVFTKLKSDESWQEDIRKSYDNKLFFEKMKNPQLSIRKADRVYFRSDMRMNATYSTDGNTKQPLEVYQRYRLFLAIDYFAPQGWLGNKVKGLGSGYVGTADGLTFRPGIRYSETYTFYDFRREGGRFVCELVKVFDPYSKTMRWVSRHLAPEGEKTGVIAEIRDEI